MRPIYAGFICEKWTKYKPIKAQFAGLVTLSEWNKANRGKVFIRDNGDGTYDLLHNHLPEKVVHKRMRDNPLFPYKSVILCPECRKPFLGSSSKSKSGRHIPYYHCSRKHKYLSYTKEGFDAIVEGYVHSINFNESGFRLMERVLRRSTRTAKRRLLKTLRALLRTLTTLRLRRKRQSGLSRQLPAT